jgi:hypothetical protein
MDSIGLCLIILKIKNEDVIRNRKSKMMDPYNGKTKVMGI